MAGLMTATVPFPLHHPLHTLGVCAGIQTTCAPPTRPSNAAHETKGFHLPNSLCLLLLLAPHCLNVLSLALACRFNDHGTRTRTRTRTSPSPRDCPLTMTPTSSLRPQSDLQAKGRLQPGPSRRLAQPRAERCGPAGPPSPRGKT